VTASDNGETGFIVGSICIGAAFEGPFDHVDLLLAGGRTFCAVISVVVDACIGCGLGVTFSLFDGVIDEAVEFSDLPISDFLNHDALLDSVSALKSFEPRWLRSECFLPSIFEAADLGLNGSTASAKYS
jgi:hypothetical protein